MDQVDGLVDKGRPARAAMGLGPVSADQGAMPTEDRLGRDEEPCPSLACQQLRQGRDYRPVGPGEAGSSALAAEHGQLMAKHEDLGLLGGRVHPMDPNQLGQAADQAI